MGTRTLAPYALDKFTCAFKISRSRPSVSIHRATSRALPFPSLSSPRNAQKSPQSQRASSSSRVKSNRAPNTSTNVDAPSRACSTLSPRRSTPPTFARAREPRTRVKPFQITDRTRARRQSRVAARRSRRDSRLRVDSARAASRRRNRAPRARR